jgi:hypothetical protein
MILEIDEKYFAEAGHGRWTLRARRGRIAFRNSTRSRRAKYSDLFRLDRALTMHDIVPTALVRIPLAGVVSYCRRVAAVLDEPAREPGAMVHIAGGGFVATVGRGDWVLLNPTMEVPRLPLETDAAKRRTVVAYLPTLANALYLAIERAFQTCVATLPYVTAGNAMVELANSLLPDARVIDGRAVRLVDSGDAGMRIRSGSVVYRPSPYPDPVGAYPCFRTDAGIAAASGGATHA